MSHIQSHHSGADEAHDTFLVILKIYGDAIHLWPSDDADKRAALDGQNARFTHRVSCRGVTTRSDKPDADIESFILSNPPAVDDQCEFKPQEPAGLNLGKNDFVTFMTKPIDGPRHMSYAIDIRSPLNSSDHLAKNEKLGTAYVYIDPKFSSLGIQRTPIIENHHPVGQIQIEYLIVTNPIAYGKQAPQPDWLLNRLQMDAGHRGAGAGRRRDLPDELLENTIASFNFAHRHGADMCELDVLISNDGVPIVYHDFDVDAVAAQQSSKELGKFRIQVDEFTVKQLRDFRLLALHDSHGCPYTLSVSNQEESNRPFPTLAEVLDKVDPTCGMNIEIKWPQMLESGKMEARRYREINDFVDRIIAVVKQHANGRNLVLESFDADLVVMLRLKQDTFPVIFLSQGLTDRYERYMDIRARFVQNGIYFAQAFNLAGVDLILDDYMNAGEKLVRFITSRGLVARAWGDVGDDTGKLDFLKSIGLQCITYDKIDVLKQKRLQQQVIENKLSNQTEQPVL